MARQAPKPSTTLVALLLLLGPLAAAGELQAGSYDHDLVSGGQQASVRDGGEGGAAPAGTGKLRFRPDGTFRIVQMADLHYGESEELDARSDEAQRRVLAEERPDLVVFSGDMAGIPYAITLGNHDAEAELSRREVVGLDIATGGPLSLTRQGPPEATGASNYWLEVHPAPAAAACDAPAARVWLLDSGDRGCPPLSFGWGCVADGTLAWLNRTVARLPPAPSLAFVHIPVPQFLDAWWGGPTLGRRQEDVACSARDTGLVLLARQAGISAIYSGHDHNNDFVGSAGGLRLAYGRKSGWGSYGPPEGWLRGARVIELRLGQDAADSNTWIRQEDGSRLDQQPSTGAKDMRQLVCHCDELGVALAHHSRERREKGEE